MSVESRQPSPGNKPPDWQLAAIIDSCDDAIISKTLEGIITSWNKAAERIFGYTAEEAVGRPISMLVPVERAREEPEILAQVRCGKRIDHLETIRVTRDGRRIHVSMTISPILDPGGKIVGASNIARDITERRQNLDQIRLERERLRVTLSSIGDAVIVTDPAGFVEFLNPIAEGLTGWSAIDARGKPLESVFPIINEKTRIRVENPAARALREGIVVGLANHTILLSRAGGELAIDDSAAPIRDGSGNVSGVILVFRDVTGQRAVADFRARLSAIVENSDDAIIGKDLNGRISSWNRGAEKIFGYTQQEAIGRPITMIIPAERLAEEADIIEKIKSGRRIDHFETVRIAKDHRKVQVSLTISPILDAEGRVVGASKIARDITDKKQDERALAEAHRRLQQHTGELERIVAERTAQLRETIEELETFSSGLSHDLKAPLRSISGFAGALLEDYGKELPAEGRDMAGKIVQGCKRLSRFVDSVLAYTRLRNARLELELVDLNSLVPQVLEEYPHIREANAEVVFQKPLGSVAANPALLGQALQNLLSNAVKFVPQGVRPHVRIWTESKADRTRIWVEDNGIGISSADQEKVFGLFTRLGGAERFEGTGVGLAVVQRAARRMGGTVGVESEPGKGSRFWIELKTA